MTTSRRNCDKQNITVSLSRNVLRKAKILAARRETSVSGLLAHEIESLVGEDEASERAEREISIPFGSAHIVSIRPKSEDELNEGISTACVFSNRV